MIEEVVLLMIKLGFKDCFRNIRSKEQKKFLITIATTVFDPILGQYLKNTTSTEMLIEDHFNRNKSLIEISCGALHL
jgi:hypothetical protein